MGTACGVRPRVQRDAFGARHFDRSDLRLPNSNVGRGEGKLRVFVAVLQHAVSVFHAICHRIESTGPMAYFIAAANWNTYRVITSGALIRCAGQHLDSPRNPYTENAD